MSDENGRLAHRRGPLPTIADVAKHAGVSPMTVSRVVNDGPNVLPLMRDKVRRAVADLGYVPNLAARNLAGARQCRIALLYSNPSAAFLSELLTGGLAGAAANDAQLTVEHWAGTEAAAKLVARLATHRIDAVLLPAPLCEDAELRVGFAKAGILVAQIAPGRSAPDAYGISIDYREAARMMTARLISLGHDRIGFISGDPNQSASALRREGYDEALREAGIAADPALVVAGDFTYRSGLAAAEALLGLGPRPTAIFASNDDMAAAAVSIAHRFRLGVPEDLSICGFDDTAMATTIWPELTTIRQPVAEMMQVAIRRLVASVTGEGAGGGLAGAAERVSFDLIARGSDGPPRGRHG